MAGNPTFEEIEQISKQKEEKEARYQANVQTQVNNTKMLHGQFERRRYTKKAELAQLIAAWRKELGENSEVLKDEALEKILKDVEEYVTMDVTATHATDMDKNKEVDISYLGTKAAVKKESGKVAEIFEDVKKCIEKYEADTPQSPEEEDLLSKRQVMVENLHLFLEEQMNGFLPEVPKGAKHIKAKETMQTASVLEHLWDYRDRPLFAHDPSPSDISQGYLGDCYMVATLANVASKNPDLIKEAMRDNGDGTVTVRLFQRIPHYSYPPSEEPDKIVPYYVTVEKTAPIYYGSHNNLWVAMFEKAIVASGLALDRDSHGRYARPVPENIDELYEKYKDMPEYLRPTKLECPWLYNEKNEFVPWQPNYKQIEGGMVELVGETLLGPGYEGSSELLYNIQKEAGKEITCNYLLKLLERETSKEFVDQVENLLSTQEKAEDRLYNAVDILQAVKNKTINYTTYQPKLNPKGKWEALGDLSGNKVYKQFADALTYEMSEMLYECNLSNKKTEEIMADIERKVITKLQAEKHTNAEKVQADAMLDDLAKDKMVIAEELRGGNYPKSYLKQYEEIKQALEKGNIVGASSPAAGEGDRKVNGGINYQHAYNVLGVTEEKVGDKTYKFLYMRNPHGGTLIPEYDFSSIPPRVKGGRNEKSEGIFKMELSHFINNMHHISFNGKALSSEQTISNSTKRAEIVTAWRTSKFERLFISVYKDVNKALKKEKIAPARLKKLIAGMKGLAGKPGEEPKTYNYISDVKAVIEDIFRSEKLSAETARILKGNYKIINMFFKSVEDPIAELSKNMVDTTLSAPKSLYDFVDIREQNEFLTGVRMAEGEGAKLLKSLADVDPWLVSSSNQFKNMMKTVKQFGDTVKELKKNPTEEKMEEYIQSLKEMAVASKEYVDFKTKQRTQEGKGIQFKSKLERKRVDAAKKIMEYAAEKSKNMEKSYVQLSLAVKLQKEMFPEQEVKIQDFRVMDTVNSKEFKKSIEGKTIKDLKNILKDPSQMKKLATQFEAERGSSINKYIQETEREFLQVLNNGLSTEEEKTNATARYIYGNMLKNTKDLKNCSEKAVRAKEKEFTDLIKKENNFKSYREDIDTKWVTQNMNPSVLKNMQSEFEIDLSNDKKMTMQAILENETKEIAKREAEIQKEEKTKITSDNIKEENEINMINEL